MVTSSPSYLCCFAVSVLLLALPSHSADPDQLQDFCVTDFTLDSKSDNVFPCKPIAEVTSDDFVFDGAREKGNITDMFGLNVYYSKVLTAGQMFVIPRALVHFLGGTLIGVVRQWIFMGKDPKLCPFV